MQEVHPSVTCSNVVRQSVMIDIFNNGTPTFQISVDYISPVD